MRLVRLSFLEIAAAINFLFPNKWAVNYELVVNSTLWNCRDMWFTGYCGRVFAFGTGHVEPFWNDNTDEQGNNIGWPHPLLEMVQVRSSNASI